MKGNSMSDEGPRILELILDEVKNVRAKVENSDARLDSIDVTLVKQNATLEEHVRRSDLLERKTDQLAEDMKPLEKHVTMVNGGLKLLGIIGTIVAIIVGIFELVKAVL